MRKVVLALVLIGLLISCEAESIILEEGVYFDGYALDCMRLLVVDEWGEHSTELLEADYFWVEGFAYHEGRAGAPWITHQDPDRALCHLDQATAPIKLHWDDDTGCFYVLNQKITEDWLTLLAEAEKYKERVFVPNRARPGEIVLTEEAEADPSLIKKITVIGEPKTRLRYENLVGVKGKELHLLEPRNYAAGVHLDVKVDLTKGDATVSLIIDVFVAGLAPL